MIASTGTLRLKTHQGIMAGLALQKEPEIAGGVSSDFFLSTSSRLLDQPILAVVRNTPAELIFPTFGYSLPVSMASTVMADQQRLMLRIEIDGGVALAWRMHTRPTSDGERILLEGTVGIELTSDRPRAHFVAATLQALLRLDEAARLQAPEIRFSANAHFADSLKTVSGFLQRRQLAHRLMAVEKTFQQQFSVPPQLSESERSDVGFVYRAVVERTFDWSFWQDSFALPASQQARTLLAKLDGAHPFVIEIGCLQQPLLGHRLSLGQVNVVVQNAALVNPDEVERALQQPDGHTFQATIRSLSGRATYQFFEAPALPPNVWEPRVAALIALEDKLDEQFFQAVNRLAAASLAGLTATEKAALTESFTLDEEAFVDPN